MSALDRFSLRNQVIILTGGAGLYGRGLVRDLASAGAELIIASRNIEALEKVAAEERADGHTVTAMQLDQADEASVLALRDAVLAKFGRIDGLVNNAVARPMKSPDSLDGWIESMRVNATGLYLVTHHIGKVICDQGKGSVVNIGSMQGMIGPSFELYAGTNMGVPPPDYFFHKGGMINFTRYYAALFGPKGVRVNCLSPGGFFNNQPEPFLTRYNEHTMLNRMADPEDLGGSVIFLLSDASKYITGANLAVDGGYTAK
ncbi:MAG: SDR family oxidoreductase [Verrucomicrobiaceae bacterium]|nr:SDR family oxidoreductase [Verrucomicrobiaceae bacterium]